MEEYFGTAIDPLRPEGRETVPLSEPGNPKYFIKAAHLGALALTTNESAMLPPPCLIPSR